MPQGLRRNLILLLAIAACDSGTSKSTPRPAPPVVAPAADARAPIGEGVPFDCTKFVPSSGSGCNTQPQIPPAATALVASALRLLEWQAEHFPPEDRWKELRTAIDAAAALDPKQLSIEQRVVVQNAALRIAIYGGKDQAALAKAALVVVDRLAPTAKELASLGDAPRLEGWLGPSTTWRHRDRRNQAQLHALFNQHAKYFRPVLAGERRAVFSQLFAIDTAGALHLTPIVGEIEMRASSDDASAACAMEVDLAELQCNPPGLVAANLLTHPTTHFFRRVESDKVACNSCHTATTFPVVPEAEAAAVIASEMKAASTELETALLAVRPAR